MTNRGLLIFLVTLSSCSSKDALPDHVMPVNTMKLVMWDLIQADEYANIYLVKDSTKSLKQETLKLYGKVFAKNKVSAADLESSLKYYKTHPASQKVLLDSLQSYTNKMREKNYESRLIVLPAIADSAKK